MGKTRIHTMKFKYLAYAVAFTLVITCTSSWPSLRSAWTPPLVRAQGAGGTLDPDFGFGGKVTTDFAGGADLATAVAVQRNGKIVVVGGATNFGTFNDFALARYNRDGTLDPSFGVGGKVTTAFGSLHDAALGVAVQQNGKIVAAGVATNVGTGEDFALARYNSDGTLDPTFGSGGKVTTDFAGIPNAAYAVAVQGDGKIIVVGNTSPPDSAAGHDFALARYNSDGTLDTSFGPGGKVTTDFASSQDSARAMALQHDGKIVAAGVAFNLGTGADFALARYNSDGTLDASFGASGKVTTDFGGTFDETYAVAMQQNGKIVAAGNTFNISIGYDFALVRYNSDGTLDASFGSGGKVATDFGGFIDRAFAVAMQQNGRIVAVGESSNDFALARYNNDGTLDAGFGSGGKVTTDLGVIGDTAYAVAVQPNGKIIAAGWAYSAVTTFQDFALARYE